MPYHPLKVANYFIEKSFATGDVLTPMKLLKLAYIAHGWNLAIYDRPLLSEAVQAWKYGPVVPSIYRNFRQYGGDQITSMLPMLGGPIQQIDPEEKALLDRVWQIYKGFDAVQLSAMTHQPGTPWAKTVAPFGRDLPQHLIIPNDLIKDYYQQLSRAPGA